MAQSVPNTPLRHRAPVSTTLAFLFLGLGALAAVAQQGVVLRVDGRIEGGAADFTMTQLGSLETAEITTATPWHDGTVTFEGVPLETLMGEVAATGERMSVQALNGYETSIPISDLVQYGPLLATHIDGEPMSIAERGPLFIIYPFDDDPALNNELFYSRSVWQVRSISVE